jgi:hypothetical protein
MPAPVIGGEFVSGTRVFISYRRQDTAATAEHLHNSLARRFGADKVFRDVVTIEPGRDYATVIEQAIAGTSVFIALIGKRWLTLKGRDGVRRLDAENDLVRLEVESGLRHAPVVIPVLADGAEMPTPEQLPPSIAALAGHNAFRLSWHEEVGRIGRQVAQVERERAAREAAEIAERERLDLTRGGRVKAATWRSQTAAASFNVAISAMELSLERQGRHVRLAPADFWKSMEKVTGHPLDQGFMLADLVYVVDFVGIKARRGGARFVARSYPISSLDEAVAQLALGRPVLTGVQITQAWFEEPASTTGRIDEAQADPRNVTGSVLGAIVAWDPRLEELRLLTPWPTWGDGGEATLTRQAAERSLGGGEMRSIETVEMPAREDA